jgi:hypothetical protein
MSSSDRDNYRAGFADGSADSASGASAGIIAGVVLVGLAGLGSWFLLGGQSIQKPAETNIINVPSAPAPQVPDVKVDVPAPKIEVPTAPKPTNE